MSFASQVSALAGAVRDKINLMVPRLLPAGGSTGQVLTKTSVVDYAAGWTTPSGGGGGTSITVSSATLTITANATEHYQTISHPGVSPSAHIQAWLAPASTTDENEPEMLDLVTISGQPSLGEIAFTLTFATAQRGPILIKYTVL